MDGWLKVRGWARIGVLIARLRTMVDELIARKIEDPSMSYEGNSVINMVTKLIELNGLDA